MVAERTAATGVRDAIEQFAVTPWHVAEEFVTLAEIERAARERLDEPTWNFLVGGSGDEWTLARNRRAFDQW